MSFRPQISRALMSAEWTTRRSGAFASYGGHGATQSSTIVYEIESGGRLGWHTDAPEETQYISPASANYAWKVATSTRSDPVMSSSSRRPCGTTSSTRAKKPCGRSLSLPRPCSRGSLTTLCCRQMSMFSEPRTGKVSRLPDCCGRRDDHSVKACPYRSNELL
jgi:hypothetical protein